MGRVRLSLATGFTAVVLGCAAVPTEPTPSPVTLPLLEISRVSCAPKTMRPEEGVGTVLRFDLSMPARVRIRWYDRSDRGVATIDTDGEVGPGPVEFPWNGLGDGGIPLPSGVYEYVIEASAADVRGDEDRVVHDLMPFTYGQTLSTPDQSVSEEGGGIAFLVPQMASVNLVVGLKDGTLERIFHDWEPMEPTERFVPWDGRDLSGAFHLYSHPERVVVLNMFALAANSVIALAPGDRVQPSAAIDVERRARRVSLSREAGFNHHALHSPDVCHAPRFSVVVQRPAGVGGDAAVSGVVPVRIAIDPRDRLHIESARFEIVLFVDNVFLFEDEDAPTPFTYQLDTRGMAGGDHVLTVNVLTYDQHNGVAVARFRVQ